MVANANFRINLTRAVIVEIKYINTKNIAIHSENCKLEVELNIPIEKFAKKICKMAGIKESSKKRGFSDYTIELFYVDFIEEGQLKKAPFVLRTDDQLAMFAKSQCKSILVTVLQRFVQFEKGTINIILQTDKDESHKVPTSLQSTTGKLPNLSILSLLNQTSKEQEARKASILPKLKVYFKD